jgi:hypothetical protein
MTVNEAIVALTFLRDEHKLGDTLLCGCVPGKDGFSSPCVSIAYPPLQLEGYEFIKEFVPIVVQHDEPIKPWIPANNFPT